MDLASFFWGPLGISAGQNAHQPVGEFSPGKLGGVSAGPGPRTRWKSRSPTRRSARQRLGLIRVLGSDGLGIWTDSDGPRLGSLVLETDSA